MILDRARPRGRSRGAGQSLYLTAVAQARSRDLYAAMGAPDTVEGRFELLTLHVILLIHRLRGDDTGAATRQVLFDTYVSNLDGALREMGVGDLAVGKRMKALGGAFYGRAESFERALRGLPDHGDLEALLTRTVFSASNGGDAPAMATYVLKCHSALAAAGLEELLEGRAPWPNP